VVFPVPRGPKRKKLWVSGGLSNLGYIIPIYIFIWNCQDRKSNAGIFLLNGGQAFPGVRGLGKAGVGIFPEVEEFSQSSIARNAWPIFQFSLVI
jgi:hypothetical protein